MSSHEIKHPFLTKIAHGCTPFITTFIVVHLASPAVASFGGSALSSKVMLLSREYYQTAWGEPLLVLAPIVFHVGAGAAKRVLSTSPGRKPRPLSSIITYTGYALGALFLPIHFTLHRVYPTTVDHPINALGPAELDYEFVKYGLQRWPIRSWVLYAGLVSCVALHGIAGVKIIWQTWFGGSATKREDSTSGRKRRGNNLVITASSIVAPVLVGIFALSREPSMMFSSTAARFKGVFQRSWIYRI
ncbi:hypothetical protein AX15_005019 [Amanita polypyramis BW_CC]|nr:hypothetical protein AX15_005019 [Amanita polypyramis BW_CC]